MTQPVYWVQYEVGEAKADGSMCHTARTEIYDNARREFKARREIRDVTCAFLFRQDIPGGGITLIDEYHRPTSRNAGQCIALAIDDLIAAKIAEAATGGIRRIARNEFTISDDIEAKRNANRKFAALVEEINEALK